MASNPTVLIIPPNFGLVAGVVGASVLVHLAMGSEVSRARKEYGVKYPDLYATAENCKDPATRNKFNCIQRGHQNCLENHASFLGLLITAGTQYPIASSILGAVYLVGKVVYFRGYSTGLAEKRGSGHFSYIGLLGLMGICLTIGGRTVYHLTQSA